MAIIRNKSRKKYTVIDNEIFKNKELSLISRGMLATLLSLPDDWEFSENGLEIIFNDSLYIIKKSLHELEQLGYLKRNRIRNDKGQLKNVEYIIYEKPIFEIPTLATPTLVIPTLVDLPQYNTNIINNLNNKKLNNKEIYKERFLKFYESYPRKETKSKTEEWFIKHKPDEELFNLIMNKLEIFKRTWKIKKYIPMPITWLNNERWQDDIEVEETIEERLDRLEREGLLDD